MPKKSAIAGITIEIGGDTKELNEAISDVNTKSQSLRNELLSVNRLLKFDPSNTELLAQKQTLLTEAINNSKEKLDTLKEAEKQVQEQFERGDATAEQVRALSREIIATENKLKDMEKQSAEVADALQQVGEESEETGENIKDTGNSADKAGGNFSRFNARLSETSDELEDTSENAEKAGSEIENTSDDFADAAEDGLKKAAGVLLAIVGSLAAAAEGTKEYRTAMGKLNTAFVDSGYSSEAAYNTYKDLYAILGETDKSVEAANHLAKLTDNERDLSRWTTVLTGVYATFGDSLPVEGLSEASNETAKTGKITGVLADALNWAGINEDDFQKKLDDCTTEQERQDKILSTLEKTYESAAATYEANNKVLIEANEATEDWNESLAETGETVEPVSTALKKMGTKILKDNKKAISDISDTLAEDIIPLLGNTLDFLIQNKDKVVVLTASIGSMGVALSALKNKEKILDGLNGAIRLVTEPNSWVVAVGAVVGLTAAIVEYRKACDREFREVRNTLSETEQKHVEAAAEAAESWREAKEASEEAAGGMIAQLDYTSDLAEELQKLADESGRVKDADKSRAEYILGELNDALGTEYEMSDNQIQNYDELKNKIYELIEAEKARAVLEAYKDDYVTAIQNQEAAIESVSLTYNDYIPQLTRTQEAAKKLKAAEEELTSAQASGDTLRISSAQQAVNGARYALSEEQGILNEKKAAYDQASLDANNYTTTIMAYEHAQQLANQGNYEEAIALLVDKGDAYKEYTDIVDEETAKVLSSLETEAIEAGYRAKETKKNFENGVKGYTEEMVKEAEKSYEDAMAAYGNAYDDAVGVGDDIGAGMESGLEGRKQGVFQKIRNIVKGIFSTARNEADSHSPSRKMIDVFEDIGEGGVVGLENKTEDLLKAAQNQVSTLLGTFQGNFGSLPSPIMQSTVGGSSSAAPSSFNFSVTIENFYNSTDKDMRQLTEEFMQTAEDYIRRRRSAFA